MLCYEPIRSRGLCTNHHRQFNYHHRHYGTELRDFIRQQRTKDNQRTCALCPVDVSYRRMCSAHYQQWLKNARPHNISAEDFIKQQREAQRYAKP